MFSKLFRGAGHLSGERAKLYNSLIDYKKCVPHGFPHQPSALAFDAKLGLLAIGTKNGLLRVYGQPGVEFSAELESKAEIKQVQFIAGRGQLIVLLEDATIQLWELNRGQEEGQPDVLEKVHETDHFAKEQADRSPKQLTTLTVHLDGSVILVGSEGGNVYALNLDTLELSDQTIYQDVVLQTVPEDYKKSTPGEVEVIVPQPNEPDRYLIGYNHGLLALWNNKTLTAEHFYDCKKTIESVSWVNERSFVSSHNDGTVISWNVGDNLEASDKATRMPYGPFPCKAITKIVSKPLAGGATLDIFAGGMPRATYGDKFTLSLIQSVYDGEKHAEQKHITFDLTSRVIDFVVIDGSNNLPSALLVLAEEELVVVDLAHPSWLEFKLPILSSVHSSAITCVAHHSNVADDVWQAIVDAGHQQFQAKYSTAAWPLTGGQAGTESFSKTKDLLITGHEDGSVRFWDASGVNLSHLYSLNTAKLFSTDDFAPIDGEEEVPLDDNSDGAWPPFRKVGTFDPFIDDLRLAIRRISLCPISGVLVVAGAAGQVIVFKTGQPEAAEKLTVEKVDVGDVEGFAWKGHDQLHARQTAPKQPEPGYQATALIQITPPAAISALTLHSEWNLLAAGTAHGFLLFDLAQSKLAFSKSLLNASDLTLTTAGGDGSLITRRKSLKQSLRESFRRLRAGRTSKRKSASSSPTSSPSKEQPDGAGASKASSPAIETRPVERQVESRSSDDTLGSVVRCLYLGQAVLTNGESARPTLWCGTNAGLVLVHAVTVPEDEKRQGEDCEAVTCTLAKELKLKHGAPALFIHVLDSTGYPMPGPLEVKSGRAKAPSTVGNQRVLIASEEQFKLFALPTLRAVTKHKLTAYEGSRVRKIAISEFTSKDDDKIQEHVLVCITNQGDVTVNALTDLKRINVYNEVVKRENVHGISTATISHRGDGFFLHSSSEFSRFALSVNRIVLPACHVEIPEGVRPPREIPPPIAAASVEPIAEKSAKPEKPADEKVDEKKDEEKEKVEPVPEIVEKSVPPVPEPEPKVEEAKADDSKGIEEEDPCIVLAKVDDKALQFVNSLNEEPAAHDNSVPAAPATNGHHEQVNGYQNGQNGSTDSELKQSSDSLTGNDSSLNVTIDPVTDHMANLSVSEEKKPSKIVPPSTITDTKNDVVNDEENNDDEEGDENSVTSPTEPVPATGNATGQQQQQQRGKNQNRGGGAGGRKGNRNRRGGRNANKQQH